MKTEDRKSLSVAVLLICMAIGSYTVNHILIPATHSIKYKLLWRSGGTPTAQNDYMMFVLNDDYLPEGETHLVKRLGCIEGQYLSKLNRQFYCDGKEIAIAAVQDSTGKPLPVFSFTGVIPRGKAFAVGDTDNSYDSRYWGFMDIRTAERLTPIF